MILDLIMMHSGGSGVSSWTPADLFLNGEEGAWYDASDWTTMFQDGPATSPITAVGQTLGAWLNKIPNQPSQYSIGQASALPRPTIVSNSGKLAVRFDGTDDQVGGNVVNKNYTALTMAVGQKKSTNQSINMLNVHAGVAEIRNDSGGGVFAIILERYVSSTTTLSLSAANTIIAYGSPTVPASLRTNGVTVTGTTTAAPAWNIQVNLPGTAGNACDISQVVFINRAITVEEVALLETFIASKQ